MEEKLKLELDGVEVGLTNQPSRIEVGSIEWIGLDLIRIRPRKDRMISLVVLSNKQGTILQNGRDSLEEEEENELFVH